MGYYKSGRLKSEALLRYYKKEMAFKEHGPHKEYCGFGQFKKAVYDKGRLTGEVKVYDEDGSLYSVATYEDGEKTDINIFYDSEKEL